MNPYKQHSLIPSQQPEAADAPAGEPSKAGPNHDVPLAPATGEPIVDLTAATQPKAATADARPVELWSNDRWAVTEAGLVSRYESDNGQPIDYVIERERLLRVLPGTAVSMWGPHLAGKAWVDDPGTLMEALAEALRRHHPGQTVVDLAATREHAAREWARWHHRNRAGDGLGWEYEPGEATLRRLEQRGADGRGTTLGGGPPE